MDDEADSGGHTAGLLASSPWGSSTALLAVVGPGGHLTGVDSGWHRVLGWTVTDLVSVPLLDFMHPDDVDATQAALDTVTEQGQVAAAFGNRFRGRDGRYCWLSWTVRPTGDDGSLYCLVHPLVDMPVRQGSAEPGIGPSHRRGVSWTGESGGPVDDGLVWVDGVDADLVSGVDGGPVGLMGAGLVVQDSSGAIVGANAAAGELLGLSWDQLVGRTSRDPRWSAVSELGLALSGDQHPAMRTLASGEPVASFLMGVLIPDRDRPGRTGWLEVSTYPVDAPIAVMAGRGDAPDAVPADRLPVGVVSVFTGASETLRGRTASDRLLAAYRLLAENATDVVWHLDGDGVIDWVSPSPESKLGWAPEQLLGTPAADLVHPDDQQRLRTWRADMLAGVRVPALEVRMGCADGSYRWMSSMTRPIPASDGGVPGRIVGLRDVHEQVLAREQLTVERSRLRATLDSLLDPSTLLDPVRDGSGMIVDFTYIDANPAACAYLKTEREHLIGETLLDVNPGLAGAGLSDVFANVVESGQALVLDDQPYALGQTGSQRFYDVRGALAGDAFCLTWRDVTERHDAAATLAAAEHRFRLLAENATDVVWQADRDDALVWVSPSVEPEMGWYRQQLIGMNIRDLIHPDDLAAAEPWRAQLQAGAAVPALEARALGADGDYRWMSLHGRWLTGADGSTAGLIVGMRDIDEEVVARTALAHAIEHDPLTGLATLPVATARIDRLLAAFPTLPPRVVSVLCIGVDSLTPVNQALTHTGGDRVLLEVAARIATVEHNPDLLARGSGDEFLVILPELVSGADAGVIADRIRLAVHGPITIGTTRLEPTVSIGIATGARGAHAEQVLRDASIAMRQAKDNGRDRCEFLQSELAVEAHHRLEIEEGIRDGLRRGQFVPWVQPIVDFDGGDIVGYEALVRWVRPDGSIVAPDDFLPVAERTALIADIDAAVLRQAVDLLAGLPEPRFVAVNVSAATLARMDYAHAVIEELQRSGAAATRLHVEFTETALLHVTDRVKTIMTELAEAGVLWYVDDFGTGYSSISHLRDLPVAGLKLDLSFTADIRAGDPTSERLAKALIGLAEGLGLDTIAEGVETPAEAATLLAQGWKHAQGWLYGRPQPGTALQLP